jgi:phage baseplate assembly protein W
MPLERVKRGYKDLSMSFKSNPLNDDLIGLKNESAIARSIRNIVYTLPGEKFFDSDFGSDVTGSLFENIDEVSAVTIREEIEYCIKTYEPRVNLIEVQSIPNYDNNEYNVLLTYEVLGADVPPQELEFVLLPAR